MTANTDFDREFHLPSVRDLIAPIFRHRRAGIVTALAVLVGTAMLVLLSPPQYEAEMKFLVKRERADTIVSADSNAPPQRADVTEDELNSEVELLKSPEILEQVASRAGLVPSPGGAHSDPPHAPDDRIATARAVRELQESLRIIPVRRTTFISVTYRSPDPQLAERVLSELATLYLEKHLALHRPPGAYQFFTAQAARFHDELRAAEARLRDFGRTEHVVSAEMENVNTLQQLSQFQAALQQARAEIAESRRRMADLEAQAVATPPRQTTQIRSTDNADLMRELESGILGLEVKHSEMLKKFAPTYPPVVELEAQLTHARAALERVQQSPLTEEITDQNPTHQWLRSELARVRAELAAAVARETATAASVRLYEEKARKLEEQALAQQNLKREMKSAEDNYLLYLRKQEEARISDALDRTRIANVVLAQGPTVPALPSTSTRSWIVILGCLMAIFLGIGMTYLMNYISPYFHTPEDIETTLNIPVLASLRARN